MRLSVKVAPAGSADVVRVGILSVSEALTPKVKLTFSVVDLLPIESSVGGWLPASNTVIVITSESTANESSVA